MPTGLGGEQMWLCPSLDDSANDISGNGNNGTYSLGMGTIAASGSGGTRAYDFDGFSANIVTLYADTSTTSTGVFTMSCWVKYDSVVATSAMMSGNVQTNKTGLSLYFDVYASSRGHRALMNPKVAGVYTGLVEAADRDSTSTGTWYHVAYTGDGTTARLYVNGTEVDSAAITLFSSSSWDAPLTIGCWYTGSNVKGYFLDGLIDDARVFNRTITPAEVVHLATSRGIEGGPSSDNFSPFSNAKYINRNYQIPRFG